MRIRDGSSDVCSSDLLWRRNGAKRFNYYQRPPMLTGQPPNLPIIGRRVNAERQSLKLRAEIISLAAAFHCAFVKHLETGLLHLGELCLDIIIPKDRKRKHMNSSH